MRSLYLLLVFAFPIAMSGLVHASIVTRSVTAFESAGLTQPRIVEVVYFRPDVGFPCRVYYTKDGIREEVGAWNNNAGGCENVERKMIERMLHAYPRVVHELQVINPEADVGVSISELWDAHSGIANGLHAVILDSLTKIEDANYVVAELRRQFPRIEFGVFHRPGADEPYEILLASGVTAARAQSLSSWAESQQILNPRIVSFDPSFGITQRVRIEWERYALSACFAEGEKTQRALAKCSGLVVDQAEFSSCLLQGPCRPKRLIPSVLDSLNTTDVLQDVFELDSKLAGCLEGSLNETEAQKCAMKEMLSENQQRAIACVTTEKGNDIAECLAAGQLSAQAKQSIECHSRHGGDYPNLLECALQGNDRERLNRVTECASQKNAGGCLLAELGDISPEVETCLYSAQEGKYLDCALAQVSDDLVVNAARCLNSANSQTCFVQALPVGRLAHLSTLSTFSPIDLILQRKR